jgi:hypothetical protein
MKQEYCKSKEQKQMFSDRLHLIKDDNKTVEPEMNSPQDKYKL